MKQGRSIQELATEIERQSKAKKDYIADSRRIELANTQSNGLHLILQLSDGPENFKPTKLFNNQLSQRLSIPSKYYQRMQESAPNLLCGNVNHWLNNNPEKRMIRTLDGNARAFLSNRYRPLDNAELAEAVLPALKEAETDIVSSQLTDTRFYIQAVCPKINSEIRRGDPVQAGVVISNSEVGMGSLKVEPLIYRLVCLNGMIAKDSSMRKYHTGQANLIEIDDAHEFYRDETRKQMDRTLWMQVRDLAKGALNEARFETMLEKMRKAAEQQITINIPDIIEISSKKYAFTENESGGILRHLSSGGDLTKWGFSNAISRTSQDVSDYDRAIELERISGDVIELSNTEWNDLNKS